MVKKILIKKNVDIEESDSDHTDIEDISDNEVKIKKKLPKKNKEIEQESISEDEIQLEKPKKKSNYVMTEQENKHLLKLDK